LDAAILTATEEPRIDTDQLNVPSSNHIRGMKSGFRLTGNSAGGD